MLYFKKFFLFFIIFLFFSGCSTSLKSRIETAKILANKNLLKQNDIETKKFIFRTYGKFDKSDVLKVYIEGDGLAWINKHTISPDPTPINPIALNLASNDKTKNLIYIARPCQYILKKNINCEDEYWTKKRFSKEVVESYNELLDKLKMSYGFKSIELIGFSGGAAIAVLVSSLRDDVKKITTIAGNLNHELVNKIHKVSKLRASLNPIDVAKNVSHIKQIHYVGTDDKIIPIDIVNSFIKASENKKNITVIKVDASHTKGWDKLTLEQ